MSTSEPFEAATADVRTIKEHVSSKLRVPTWEEIAVLDAELQRRARKPALKLVKSDRILEGR